MDLHKAGLAWRWRPNPSESDCLLIYRYRQSAQLGLPCAAGLLRIRPNPPESDPPSQPQSRPYIFGLLVVATCLRLTTLPPGRNLATARCEYTRVSYNGVTASSGRRRMSRGDGAAPTRNFRDRSRLCGKPPIERKYLLADPSRGEVSETIKESPITGAR